MLPVTELRPAKRSERIIAAVRAAVARGFVVGRKVKIGVVQGVVIGYNIDAQGRYRGGSYPLLIKTDLGVTKCAVDEVVAA